MTRIQMACAFAAALTMTPAGVGAQPAVDRALAREILAELVALPTHAPEGAGRAADALAARLAAAGFPKADVQILGPTPAATALVARYRGRDPKARAILLMSHIDVVPARREDWSVDPWTLTERDGWFYGRGTGDNKFGAAVVVANFITLKRAGWQPDRDIVFLATGDEETGQAGIKWLLAEHRPLVDAEVAFNTDAGGVSTRDGRPLFFDLQTAEKIYADFQLELTDPGGHSSLARPDNPIYTLAAALTRIAEHRFPLQLSDATRMFFDRAAATEEGQTALDMRAMAKTPPDQAAAARLSRSPLFNARLRTTCVATRVEAGHANNALPQLARAVVNCRILPGTPEGEVEAVIRRLAGDRVTVTVLEPPTSTPPSPVSQPLLGRIETLVARHWPGIPVIPTLLTGATDGMHTRSAGIPTYGVSGVEQDPEDLRFHGRDERIGVEAFYTALAFWHDLIRTFGAASAPATAAQSAPAPIGYDDTPMQPHGKWRVHDGDRPVPRVVTPGASAGISAAPSDALVLLGSGSDLGEWQMTDGSAPTWMMRDGVLLTGKGMLQTRRRFRDFQLHVEWATPSAVKGDSQGRGNSGVFLLGRFEVQVLDSYGNRTYPDGQAASMYGQYPPLVNVSRGPGEWQGYDIVFRAPRFAADGSLASPATVTVLHNGVVVHHATPYWGPTRHKSVLPYTPDMAEGPIALQDHGNPVRYRNIWIRPLGDYDAP